MFIFVKKLYMKKFLLLTLMIIPLLSTSQNELRNFETLKVTFGDTITNKYFLYRISFDNITTLELSKTIIPELMDIFKSVPHFFVELSEYNIISNIDIGDFELYQMFNDKHYKPTYFRKENIN
jgi:hypothetical protein